jgi:hypothetical protein
MMYDVVIYESKSKAAVIYKAKCDAPNEAKAQTRVLNDLMKLDKLGGNERPWLSYHWEITKKV